MTISLKHTTDARKEIFTPCQFTGKFYHQSARRFNLVRLAETGDFTLAQIQYLRNVVMLSDGKGDNWTAVLDTDLGLTRFNSNAWIAVEETVLELAQRVVDEA